MPGINQEADQNKIKAKQRAYIKEYTRGSILDRNGLVLAKSEKPGAKREYQSPYAYSSLLGYYSATYGSYGIENKLADYLIHSKSYEDNKRGADVTLTIDATLQEKAYDSIRNMNGSVVILDVKTGEILALASSNAFNANELEENWEEINQTEGIFYPNAYKNPVTPGSVFKLVTSKEILDAGIDREIVDDQGSMKINGQTIRNYGGEANGPISFQEGLIHSSNVYFMDRALKLGGSKLQETADAFLIGHDIELDFTTLKSNFDLEDYSDNIVASTAFGQGNTQITPLHMAMVAQAIANDGTMLKPYMFANAVDGKGKEIFAGETTILKEAMTASTAGKIRRAMAKAAEHYDMPTVGPAYRIAAKTGTAERGDGTNNAWFVSFAPANNPQYVIVLNRLKTEEVGKSLAPIAEELYDLLFQNE